MDTRFIAAMPPPLARLAMPLKFGAVLAKPFLEQAAVFLRQTPSNFLELTPMHKAYLIGFVVVGVAIPTYAHFLEESDLGFNGKEIELFSADSFDQYFTLQDVPGDGSCFYHAIARQIPDQTVENLRNMTADAIEKTFEHCFADGGVINGGEYFEKEGTDEKVSAGKEGGPEIQLRTEMQDNRIIAEGVPITREKFDEYLAQIREHKGTESWGSDFHAKYLAQVQKLDTTIHIVRSVKSFFDLSWIMALFFNVQQQSVRSSYHQTVYGNGEQHVYIYHSGKKNHYQILKLKTGKSINDIYQDA